MVVVRDFGLGIETQAQAQAALAAGSLDEEFDLLVRGGVPDVAWSLVDAEGHFEFPAVPAESVRVGQRLPGYKFSRRNQSLDPNSDYIVGRVDHALTNLTLELEPGEFRYTLNHEDAPAGTDPNPRDNRLRGVPAGP